jgi:hypothetical protein
VFIYKSHPGFLDVNINKATNLKEFYSIDLYFLDINNDDGKCMLMNKCFFQDKLFHTNSQNVLHMMFTGERTKSIPLTNLHQDNFPPTRYKYDKKLNEKNVLFPPIPPQSSHIVHSGCSDRIAAGDMMFRLSLRYMCVKQT